MTVRVYCPTCENMVHPTDPHSCFSAAAHREYREAEKAVIEAAKAMRDSATNRQVVVANGRLEDAVDALRALEGDA
jgi:biotin synthase-like enzyme